MYIFGLAMTGPRQNVSPPDRTDLIFTPGQNATKTKKYVAVPRGIVVHRVYECVKKKKKKVFNDTTTTTTTYSFR